MLAHRGRSAFMVTGSTSAEHWRDGTWGLGDQHGERIELWFAHLLLGHLNGNDELLSRCGLAGFRPQGGFPSPSRPRGLPPASLIPFKPTPTCTPHPKSVTYVSEPKVLPMYWLGLRPATDY